MQQHHIAHAVMIGDGSTDLETLPVVDCFIGYGGVIERPIVKEKASAFISSFEDLHSLYSTSYPVCNKHVNFEKIENYNYVEGTESNSGATDRNHSDPCQIRSPNPDYIA